jgi:hypothetical protein
LINSLDLDSPSLVRAVAKPHLWTTGSSCLRWGRAPTRNDWLRVLEA